MENEIIYKHLEKEYNKYIKLQEDLEKQKLLVRDLIKYYLYNGGNKNIDKFNIEEIE